MGNNQTRNTSLVILQVILALLVTGAYLQVTAPTITPFGEVRLAIIMACFSNSSPKKDASEIYDWVFLNASKQLRSISHNQSWITGDVTGWIELPNAIETYGKNTTLGSTRLVKESVSLADPDFDFSGYDKIMVIHSGPSWQSDMTDNDTLYPSTCWNNLIVPTTDMITFLDAMIVSEEDETDSIVHELCHSLGAVDLYNKAKSERHEDATNDTYIERWCIMGSGCTQMCLFNKLKVGWIKEHDIFEVDTGSNLIHLLGISEPGRGYRGTRFNRHNDSKYYLVEARTQTGLDIYKHEGVLVSLVDESLEPGYGIVDLVSSCTNNSARLGAFRVGQTFKDEVNGFYMHVMSRTENGFNISIGTESSILLESKPLIQSNWRQGYTSSVCISECINGLVYCLVQKYLRTPNVSLDYLHVLKSTDSGFSWKYLFNTSDVGMNVTQASISIVGEEPAIFAHVRNGSHFQFAVLNSTTGRPLEIIADTNANGVSSVTSNNQTRVFVTWSQWNISAQEYQIHFGTWDGISWTSSSIKIADGFRPKLSNCIQGCKVPHVLYRHTLTSNVVSLALFNTSEPIQTWSNKSEGSSSLTDYDIISVNGRLSIAYTEYGYINGTRFYNSWFVQGNSADSLEIQGCLYESSAPSMFIYAGPNSICLSALVYNESSDLWMNVNLTKDLQVTHNFEARHSFSVTKVTTENYESLVLISYEWSINAPIDSWSMYLGPIEPHDQQIYYFIHYNELNFQYPFLISVLLIGVIGITVIIVRRKKSPSQTRQWSMTQWAIDSIKGYYHEVLTSIESRLIFILQIIITALLLLLWIFYVPVRALSYATYQLSRVFLNTLLYDIIFYFVFAVALIWILNKILIIRESEGLEVTEFEEEEKTPNVYYQMLKCAATLHPFFLFAATTLTVISIIVEVAIITLGSIDFGTMSMVLLCTCLIYLSCIGASIELVNIEQDGGNP